jgi:hypothetical protein
MGVGGRRRRARRARTRRARSRRNRTPPKNREEILRETPGWIQSLKKLNQRVFEQRVERIRKEIAQRKIKDQRAAQWAKELSELYDKWRRTDTLDYTTARRINELRKKLGQPPQFFEDTLFYLRREGPIRGVRGQIRHIVEETLINTTTYLALVAPIVTIEAIERLQEKQPKTPLEKLEQDMELYRRGETLYLYGKHIREHARMLSDMADEIYKDQTIPKRQRAELASMIIDRAKELYELSDEYMDIGRDLMDILSE